MPADYRIDRKIGCVFSRATGVLTDQDLLDHQRRLSVDAGFRDDLNQIADFRGLERIDVSAAAVYALAKNNPFGRGARRAFVVDSPLVHGLTRIFVAHTDDSQDQIQVFRKYDEAVKWLEGDEASG